ATGDGIRRKKGSRSADRAMGGKERVEVRNSLVLLFVRIGVVHSGVIDDFSGLARGAMVVVLGRLVGVIAGLVTILNLALARRPHLFGGVVRVACLVVVARLVPFAGLVLFVRLIVVVTALFAAGRRGTCQV